MRVSTIKHNGRLLVKANFLEYSHFHANGLSDHAQASQGKNLQVQTGVQR